MIRAKNYETLFKFVKVMPKIPVASFFQTRVVILCSFDWQLMYCDNVVSDDDTITSSLRIDVII